jgi:nucleotide-binding universal stress UspA family protein
MLSEAAADARLVVVGAHRRRTLFSVGAGHVVDGLLAHCPTPVAVIPVVAADCAETEG